MNILGTVYSVEGRIIRQITVPEDSINIQCDVDEFLYLHEHLDPNTTYLLNHVRQARPWQETEINKTVFEADDEDKIIISKLPIPCEVWINHEGYSVAADDEDAALEFTTDVPGTYIICVKAWPYLDITFEVIGIDV
jgi:hypothetical protein